MKLPAHKTKIVCTIGLPPFGVRPGTADACGHECGAAQLRHGIWTATGMTSSIVQWRNNSSGIDDHGGPSRTKIRIGRLFEAPLCGNGG